MKTWDGCYEDGWGKLIVNEAYTHPAKFRAGLIDRIYRHGFDAGWWTVGSIIGDPFGGMGGGGIYAAYKGLAWIGVELEETFCTMFAENVTLHRRRWENGNLPIPVMIHGDSRQFAELVGACEAIVTSPPYADAQQVDNRTKMPSAMSGTWRKRFGKITDGQTPGQIGNLKAGKVDSIVTSPPWERTTSGHDKEFDKVREGGPVAKEYGDSAGQIGALKSGDLSAIVTSPPYADSVKGEHGETETAEDSRDKRQTPGGSLGQSQRHGGYGGKGNIGNLKVDSIVTSPPYEGTHVGGDLRVDNSKIGTGTDLCRDSSCNYSDSPGQLGNTSGETYWQAMDAVYRQCHLAIKPGGILVCVVKNYVKNKAIVPLCDQTADLLAHVGFTPVERIRAMLVKETSHPGLFGEDIVEKKKTASFFRRLYELKYPQNAIDWEEVICVRKPVVIAASNCEDTREQ